MDHEPVETLGCCRKGAPVAERSPLCADEGKEMTAKPFCTLVRIGEAGGELGGGTFLA
jgi:hypothetical protein